MTSFDMEITGYDGSLLKSFVALQRLRFGSDELKKDYTRSININMYVSTYSTIHIGPDDA